MFFVSIVRTPTVLLLFIVLATVANAATVTLLTSQFYESTTPWVVLDLDNRGTGDVVTLVTVNSTLPVLQAANYTGWQTVLASPFVSWTNGTIETNVRSALFEYQARLPLVNANGVIQIEARVDGVPTTLNLTVLNDNTPPAITLLSPVNFVGPIQTPVRINATDSETGVANVSYRFGPCAGTQTNITLALVNGTYTGTANMSNLVEGDTLCWTASATNNAGETATQNGQLTVDATSPSVTAIAPTSFTDETTTFTINATDNLATTLACAISVNTVNVANFTVANNTLNSTNANLAGLPEGAQIWQATCTDGVGLSGSAVQNLVLDNQAPQITLSAPSTLGRNNNGNVIATVTDTIGVASVNATLDGDLLALAQNGNLYTTTVSSNTLGPHVLAINARDNAGHVTTTTKTVMVVPGHNITFTLTPSSAQPGNQIIVDGNIAADGALTATTVTLETPSGNQTLQLTSGSFNGAFNAPQADGTYTITVRFTENNHTYSTTATLAVGTAIANNDPPITWSSSGVAINRERGVRSGGIGGGVAQSDTSTSDSSSQESDGESAQPVTPAPYEAIDPSEPRRALTPAATGIFSLNPSVKWLLLFVALFALAGLGAYAYHKRQPPEDTEKGVNWDNYFDK